MTNETEKAIEKIKREQEIMMEAALRLEQRTSKLQAIAECQAPNLGGFHWTVDIVDLSISQTNAARVRLICEKSGAVIDFRDINHEIEIGSENGYGLITLENYIAGDTDPTDAYAWRRNEGEEE